LKAQIKEAEESLESCVTSQKTETKERTEANLLYQADMKNLVDRLERELQEIDEKIRTSWCFEGNVRTSTEFRTTTVEVAKTQDTLVDAVEHSEVAEIKRAVFRALTLRAWKRRPSMHTTMLTTTAQRTLLPISTKTRRQWRQTSSSLSTEQIYVKDSNASIEDKTKEIVEKTEETATANENLIEDTESHDNAVQELANLSAANAELHAICDFVMKSFEIRQSSRDEEIQVLQQATAILSGAKFDDA